MKINVANENSTNYEMLRMILEANLRLMELSEKSTTEEQEIITYSTLKGIMEFGKVMERSFNFAKS
jgi:hypothetical protein|tara:strand:+ start:2156 stop:2353 length:198 start_codon:yes stop_codon:yes gene_type:complete